MSPNEITLIAQALRASGLTRDQLRPVAESIGNLIESKGLGGRSFRFCDFIGKALGPSAPLKPAPLFRTPSGTTLCPPPRSARLFRSYETPEALGL